MMETRWTMKICATLALAVALTASLPGAWAQESYASDYEVHLEQDEGMAEPQDEIVFPITIDNYSNEDTRFAFELEDEVTGGFLVMPPSPVVLPAASEGGEPTQMTVKLVVYTPFENGYVDESTDITLTIQPHHAEDEALKGEETTITVSAHAQGFYIPGPGAWLSGMTIGVAAILLRTAKQPE